MNISVLCVLCDYGHATACSSRSCKNVKVGKWTFQQLSPWNGKHSRGCQWDAAQLEVAHARDKRKWRIAASLPFIL
jgi:hypothetical protein